MNSSAPTLFSAEDLLAAEIPDARFAVPGILPSGLVLLVGKSKMGKSWLMLGLASAIALAGVALGQIAVEANDVLYLALEDTRRRLQGRLRAVLGPDAFRRFAANPGRLMLTREWPRLDQGGLVHLEAYLKEHHGAVVIIDTFKRVRAIRRREGDIYGQDYDEIAQLKQLADRYEATVVVVFHTRKAPAEDWLDSVNGSTGLAAAADTIICLKRERGQHDATLCVTGRDVEEQELALRWDPQTSTWSLLGNADEFRLSQERAAVLSALHPSNPMRPSEVALAIGKDANAVKQLLWKMERDRQVRSAGHGLYISNNGKERDSGNSGNGGNFGNQGDQRVTGVIDITGPARLPLEEDAS